LLHDDLLPITSATLAKPGVSLVLPRFGALPESIELPKFIELQVASALLVSAALATSDASLTFVVLRVLAALQESVIWPEFATRLLSLTATLSCRAAITAA
jgi:hypothetical protein